MDALSNNIKNYINGREQKNKAVMSAREFVSKFRDAEAVFTNIRNLCLSEKVTHDPQTTTVVNFESTILGCRVRAVFSNKTGAPLCAQLTDNTEEK